MSVAKQLNQLQEIDLEIEGEEQTLNQKVSQLGDRQALDSVQNQLASEQQQLDELRRRQKSAEWEVDDISSKITAAEQQLYSGKITNPKELSSLQYEVSTMKTRRDQLETKALETIDQVEVAEKSLAAASNELKKLEDEWHRQQHQLSVEIEHLKSRLADLKQKRQQLSGEIETQAVELYEKIRQQKRPPIARVEQGICRGCRISLSASELQRIRSGDPIQCGSCGRILFLP
jgi:predicted  nucleic acid-binding Zn-ribbon protein